MKTTLSGWVRADEKTIVLYDHGSPLQIKTSHENHTHAVHAAVKLQGFEFSYIGRVHDTARGLSFAVGA